MQLRDEVNKYKVGAPARVGLVAPNDVVVPAGNTGLDPSQTSFFQVRTSSSMWPRIRGVWFSDVPVQEGQHTLLKWTLPAQLLAYLD